MRTIISFTRTCRAFFGIRWAVENLKILGAVRCCADSELRLFSENTL